MLAEPKRSKSRYDPAKILAKGNSQSIPADNVGRQMLEKMGWSHGKGIGAKEDGIPEHIRVLYKADRKGVGCDASRASLWRDTQKAFEKVLESLNHSAEPVKAPNALDTVVGFKYKTVGAKDMSTKTSEEIKCVWNATEYKQAPNKRHHAFVQVSEKTSEEYFQEKQNGTKEARKQCEEDPEGIEKGVSMSQADSGKGLQCADSFVQITSNEIPPANTPSSSKNVTVTEERSIGEPVDCSLWFPGSNLPLIPGYIGYRSSNNLEEEIKLVFERRKRRQQNAQRTNRKRMKLR